MYLTDVLDEYVMQQLPEYEDFKFVNIAKEDIEHLDKVSNGLEFCVCSCWLLPDKAQEGVWGMGVTDAHVWPGLKGGGVLDAQGVHIHRQCWGIYWRGGC